MLVPFFVEPRLVQRSFSDLALFCVQSVQKDAASPVLEFLLGIHAISIGCTLSLQLLLRRSCLTQSAKPM